MDNDLVPSYEHFCVTGSKAKHFTAKSYLKTIRAFETKHDKRHTGTFIESLCMNASIIIPRQHSQCRNSNVNTSSESSSTVARDIQRHLWEHWNPAQCCCTILNFPSPTSSHVVHTYCVHPLGGNEDRFCHPRVVGPGCGTWQYS